ncbi:lipocalin family protein [Streptomyces sp. NPDC097619]|uniref:lipocalin family protein n=1 Tax=Streptomyces sp. NPDC097619 TaxID=3157228 RepID=UPI00331C5328
MSLHRHSGRAAVLVSVSLLLPAAVTNGAGAVAPPAKVDPVRYAGDWYQIAAIPQLFELQCKKNVRARYTPRTDGTLGVRNTCATWWGSASTVNGAARPLDSTNTRFNVSFVPRSGGGYVPGEEANYVIVGIAADYRWAAVTNEDRTAGFLLSRTPSLRGDDTADAVSAFDEAGVRACDLRLTRQDGGAQGSAPLC